MKRKCTRLYSSIDYGSPIGRSLCIDEINAAEILSSIPNRRKFMEIVERILTLRNRYYDHYKKEQVNGHTRQITAIRFLGRDNVRIYCKEIRTADGITCIICAVSHRKKVQQNDKKIKAIINKIASYEYEIIG